MRLTLTRLTLVVGSVCVLALGCGDDDDDAGSKERLASPPGQLITNLLDVAATARTAEDCRPVAKVNLRSKIKTSCPPASKSQRAVLRATKPISAATYGGAAVVDYESKAARDGASIVLLQNGRGEWTISRWGLAYGPTVGTDDGDQRARSAAAVDEYMAAVRSRDCEAFDKVAITNTVDREAMCMHEFPLTGALARAIKANPSSRPRYVGGNEDLGVYSLEIDRPTPSTYTIVAVATPEGSLRPFVVLDSQAGPARPAS